MTASLDTKRCRKCNIWVGSKTDVCPSIHPHIHPYDSYNIFCTIYCFVQQPKIETALDAQTRPSMDVPSRSKPEPQPGLTFVHPPRTDHPFMGVHVSGTEPFWWQTGVLPLHVSRPPADNYCVIGHNLKGAWLPVAVPTGQTCHLQLGFFSIFLSSTNYKENKNYNSKTILSQKHIFQLLFVSHSNNAKHPLCQGL